MKINVYGIRGFPDIQGGVEKHCEELYPRIASKDLEFKVFRRKPYINYKLDKKYPHIKFNDGWTVKNKYLETVVHSFISAFKTIKDRPDVVHIHNIGPAMTLPLIKLFGLKCVVTYHSENYAHSKWNWFAKSVLKICEKLVFVFADKVIFVSSSKMKKSGLLKSRAVVIPNGVSDFNNSKPNVTWKKLGLKKDSYILTVGRIVPEKRFSDLIRAFSKIATGEKLVIVGGYDNNAVYFRELNEYKKQLGDRLVFTGSLRSNDIKLLYENASFFVLPSESEGMPIVLLEAMSFGKCTLVSDIEENLETVKGHGYSFKVKDEKDLKRMIEFMLKNKSLVNKKGIVCKDFVKKNYNWESIAKQTLDVYTDVKKDAYKNTNAHKTVIKDVHTDG